MAGQPITRKRMEHFDSIGEDEIFDRWLGLRSVRKLVRHYGYDGSQQDGAVRAFYRWLDHEEGRRDRWNKLMEIGGHEAAEAIQDVVEEATNETVNLARLKVDHLKWRAESLNRGAYGKQSGSVNLTINAQSAWLGALRAVEEEIQEASFEVVEETKQLEGGEE